MSYAHPETHSSARRGSPSISTTLDTYRRGRRRHHFMIGDTPWRRRLELNTQLCDTTVRDVIPKAKLEELLGQSGIDNNTTIVIYGQQQLVRRLGVLAAEALRPR